MARKRVWVRSRRLAIWGGYGMLLAGSLLLYDAYENRGRSRPLGAKFIPGA